MNAGAVLYPSQSRTKHSTGGCGWVGGWVAATVAMHAFLPTLLHMQVSNGADVVMISKVFLLGRMSEVLKVKLQRKVTYCITRDVHLH